MCKQLEESYRLRRQIAVVFIVLIGLIGGVNAQGDVIDYIRNNLDDVAIMCFQADAPDHGVYHNVDEAFPLASTHKIVILAEYARQVGRGILNPNEQIDPTALELYWLRRTDGGAHQAWLDSLDETATVTLNQVVRGMIQFSSNANTDYLLQLLGEDAFRDLYEQLGLENTDYLGMFLGAVLHLGNHETRKLSVSDVEALDTVTTLAEQDRLAQRFLTDEQWRERELAYRNILTNFGLPDPNVQSAYFDRFEQRGSPADMLRVMQAAYGFTDALSEDEQAIMQEHLSWLFEVNPNNAQTFAELGFKGGSLPGIFTSAWYGQLIDQEGIYLSVMYRNIPLDVWLGWSRTSDYVQPELEIIRTGDCGVFADMLIEE